MTETIYIFLAASNKEWKKIIEFLLDQWAKQKTTSVYGEKCQNGRVSAEENENNDGDDEDKEKNVNQDDEDERKNDNGR